QRLLKYGKPLGKKLDEVITIVSPRTFARWASGETKSVGKKEAKPGRKKTADEIRELILKRARKTGAGYSKILGELKKLGVSSVCRSTVVNILKENGLDPGPQARRRRLGRLCEAARRNAVGYRLLFQEGLDQRRAGGILRVVLHQCRHAARAYRRDDAKSEFSVGGSAGSEHELVLRRIAGTTNAADSRSRFQVHGGIRRDLQIRGH
ncbi:MAG TPA: hypothetical protein VHB99_12100, partial [Pirellulales bacterium]|nr:hypothetical protein [Pirellulales bacterium]